MLLENFYKLEEKLTLLLDTLQKLNLKNKQILSEQALVSNRITDHHKERQALSQELEKLRIDKNKAENKFKNQQKEIKRRIENLLSKLEVLQNKM